MKRSMLLLLHLQGLLAALSSPINFRPTPAGVAANFAAWGAIASARRTAVCQHAVCTEEGFIGRFAGATWPELGSTNQGMRAVRAQRVRINGDACNHASRVLPGDNITLMMA